MPRPIHASVSLTALRHNLGVVRACAPGARVWTVVKANAYGHGIARVFPALTGGDGFALLDLNEAAVLRDLGYVGPILLLEGHFSSADLTVVEALGLTTVLHNREQLAMLEGRSFARPIDVYLKINSGMNRLGFAAPEARAVYTRVRALAAVGGITLMTHFASADGPDGGSAAQGVFESAIAGIKGPRSLANSAAIIAHAPSHGDWVRPGIMLYGASPFANRTAAQLGLAPAMSLHSALIALQQVQLGEAVGYGAQFVARAPMRVGVVACGYADGYPRLAPEGTPVAVDGRATRIVGRVSMDMITVDVTHIAGARVGSPVEMWGTQIPVDEVAAAAGTSGYELLCAVAPRVPVTGVP
jgi:alanine racemase